MNISDQTLSAFLDAELSETDMENIRQQLCEDEALSNRLAELSAVDQRVEQHYANIDRRPLPKAVTDLLSSGDSISVASASATVIQFPLWKRVQRKVQIQVQQHASIAAAFALAIGFGLAQVFPGSSNGDQDWQTVAQGLDNTPSGSNTVLSNGQTLNPRLTFVNQQGQYCRQFQMTKADSRSENIACRDQNTESWRLTATIELDAIQPGSYQTASGGSVLDNVLDKMMATEALDRDAEQTIIADHWNTH